LTKTLALCYIGTFHGESFWIKPVIKEIFRMNTTKLRILSKAGLLVVIIGFFMPVSCNLNGFQLARYISLADSF
jgi:hypothetical protein